MTEKSTIGHFRTDQILESKLQSIVSAESVELSKRWETVAVTTLRYMMKSKKVSYKELARRLEAMGESDQKTVNSLNRKITRGQFSAAFFLMCMSALEQKQVPVPSQSKTQSGGLGR